MYLTVVQYIKDRLIYLCGSSACCDCVIMCLYQSIVLFKQSMGVGRWRRGIQFIKKKKIPQCHWFPFGTALHNNIACILACTVSLNVSFCFSSSSGHVLLWHHCFSNHLSSIDPFFIIVMFSSFKILETSRYYTSSAQLESIALELLNCGIKT